MLSIPQQIIAQIVVVLTNATLAADRVFRSRELALTSVEVPCIVVVPATEESHVFSQTVDDNTLVVTIEVHVQGDPHDLAADPMLIDIHRLLMRDPGLQSLVVNLHKKSRSWDGHEADQTVGFVTTSYEMRYLSPSGDITTIL